MLGVHSNTTSSPFENGFPNPPASPWFLLLGYWPTEQLPHRSVFQTLDPSTATQDALNIDSQEQNQQEGRIPSSFQGRGIWQIDTLHKIQRQVLKQRGWWWASRSDELNLIRHIKEEGSRKRHIHMYTLRESSSKPNLILPDRATKLPLLGIQQTFNPLNSSSCSARPLELTLRIFTVSHEHSEILQE